MEKDVQNKQEYISNEMIDEQMKKFKFIGNDGLLYSRSKKYILNDN
ncbi:hypothetical protein KDN24_06270 [Bacillus sp. Bva_UNVM-123]